MFRTMFSALLFFLLPLGSGAGLLHEVEGFLEKTQSLESRFHHKDSLGHTYQGTLFLKRPWKFKMVYDDPSPFLMMCDGVSLIYEDHTNHEVFIFPLESSPLSFLLASTIDLKKSLCITSLQENNDTIILCAEDTTRSASLRITFSRTARQMKEFSSKDANGHEIHIKLESVKTNPHLNDSVFLFKKTRPKRNRR